MIQLSTQSPKAIAVKFNSSFPEGLATNAIYLDLINQYTKKEYRLATGFNTYTSGRGTWMVAPAVTTFPVGTYIIEIMQVGTEKLLATQLAYISGTDVIGEDDFKTYTNGDSDADIVYPNT